MSNGAGEETVQMQAPDGKVRLIPKSMQASALQAGGKLVGTPSAMPVQAQAPGAQVAKDVATGAAKGVGSTVGGLASMMPGIGPAMQATAIAKPELAAKASSLVTPSNTAQQFGFGAEQTSEFLLPLFGEEKMGIRAAQAAEKYLPGIAAKMGTKGTLSLAKAAYNAVTSEATEQAHGGRPGQGAVSSLAFSGLMEGASKLGAPVLRRLFGVEELRGEKTGEQLMDLKGIKRSSIYRSATKELNDVQGQLQQTYRKLGTQGAKGNVPLFGMLQDVEDQMARAPQSAKSALDGLRKDISNATYSVGPGDVNAMKRQVYMYRTRAQKIVMDAAKLSPGQAKDYAEAGALHLMNKAQEMEKTLRNNFSKISAAKLYGLRNTIGDDYVAWGKPSEALSPTERLAKGIYDRMTMELNKMAPEMANSLKDEGALRDVAAATSRAKEKAGFWRHSLLHPSNILGSIGALGGATLGHELAGGLVGTGFGASIGGLAGSIAGPPIATGAIKTAASPFTRSLATGVSNVFADSLKGKKNEFGME